MKSGDEIDAGKAAGVGVRPGSDAVGVSTGDGDAPAGGRDTPGRPRLRAPVMSDVGRLAGVSHQTVSRVINGSPHVRPETRARVRAAMEELGYRPNPVARALVTGRSRMLGVVSFDTTLYGPASTLFGIERAAHEAGYFIIVASLEALNRSSVVDAVERLRRQGVEGILVIAPHAEASDALLHAPSDVPLVAAEAGPEHGASVVAVDQVAGAVAATRHLLDLGHKTVWHISGPPDFIEARQRQNGWRDTLEAAGAQVPEPLAGDWSPPAGYELGGAWPGTRASPRCSSPTTRWRWGSCARCTRPAARCRET